MLSDALILPRLTSADVTNSRAWPRPRWLSTARNSHGSNSRPRWRENKNIRKSLRSSVMSMDMLAAWPSASVTAHIMQSHSVYVSHKRASEFNTGTTFDRRLTLSKTSTPNMSCGSEANLEWKVLLFHPSGFRKQH